ncbi:uncharacterized protein LOC142950926 [Anarhichas minor]|uniref:uncharacterized protein LOC142950926 n=1 Tax=Anarhichas minor TaxID=65739 RepID=UPI003F73F4A3
MSENLQKDPHVILCDMCTEEDRKPARKTCMKCEISMCVQHLQAHLTTPVFRQTHPLTEPMALCGATKCPQHGKLLEYYCLDDMICVCVSCAIEDQHRIHNMKTFSTAHRELTEKLNTEQQAMLMKTEDKNVSLEKWEKSEREKLGRSSVRLIEAVTSLHNIALTTVQSSVSARMVSIKTSKSSMQAAQKEKDTFRFLQMYSQVHQDVEKAKAVDLRKGLEPGRERDKLLQEIREDGEKMVKQAGLFCGSLLSLVNPENHQELTAATSDLIFHPQTFGPGISLSKDKRKVFYSSGQGQCSATLLKCSIQTAPNFQGQCSAILLIRSIQTAPDFQRWTVSLSRDSDWTVGLCDKQPTYNLKDGHVFGLCCQGNQLSSLTTEYDEGAAAFVAPKGPFVQQRYGVATSRRMVSSARISLATPKKQHRVSSALITHQGKNGDEAVPRPEVVEVFWNFGSSSLSFFSRTGQHQREEIITIKMSLNIWDLAPFVQLGRENAQISYQQPNHYFGGQGGDICTTEVVCELQ